MSKSERKMGGLASLTLHNMATVVSDLDRALVRRRLVDGNKGLVFEVVNTVTAA